MNRRRINMTTIKTLEKIIDIMRNKQKNSGSQVTVDTWDKAIGIVRGEIAIGGHLSSGDDFDCLVDRRLHEIHSILNQKAAEYSVESDRFHNFKIAARMNDTTPEKALKGMMLKHEVSIQDMINCDVEITEELIDEKIGDNINYLILLEGLMKEKLHAKKIMD